MLGPIVRWLIALELAGVLGLPLAWCLFRRHADLGVGLGRVLILSLFGYLAFIGSVAGVTMRSQVALAGMAACVASAAMGLAWRHRAELQQDVRTQWREIASAEALFALTWILFLVPLLYTDTSRFGERALDLAFLNALSVPGPLPPANPYLSGAPLNYYYYGHLLFASLTTLLGLPATETYLLATATVTALTVAAVNSLLSRLVVSAAGRWVGVFLTCFSMNLAYVRDWLTGHPGDTFAHSNWMVGNAINEYPLYTFLIAELHAHAMALPAFVTAIALSLALSDDVGSGGRSSTLLCAGAALSLVLGSVGPTSTWSMITLCAVALLLLWANVSAGSTAQFRQIGRLVAVWAVIVGVAVLLYAPYYAALSVPPAWPRLVGKLTSAPLGFGLHWGVFVWIVFGFAVLGRSPETARGARVRAAFAAGAAVGIASGIRFITGGTSAVPLAIGLAATLVAAVAAWGARREQRLHVSWLLTALGFFIIACCEVVYLDDYLSGNLERATTVFKFYLDAWVLLGIGTAYPVYVLGSAGVAARGWRRGAILLWAAPLVISALVGAGYTAMGVFSKTGAFRSGPYLSAVHFMDAKDRGYADAMRWLAQQPVNPARRLVIAEAVEPDRDTDWLSVAAPVHAYLAWPQQLVQWNYSTHEIRPRLDNLQLLYTLRDPAQACALMKVEGIDLVFFGTKERRRFGSEAEATFSQPPFRKRFASAGSTLFSCAR